MTLYGKQQEVIRFFLVGIGNTIFGYLVFLLFDSLLRYLFTKRYLTYMFAMVLAQIISVANAYILHKFITFRSNTLKREVVFSEFIRFSLTYVFIFCFNILFLPVFVEILKMEPQLAAGALILLSAAISYIGHSRFSFRKFENMSVVISKKK